MQASKIKTLFLDIGKVLLTNGWDTDSRKLAIDHFKLDEEEVTTRHKLSFDAYEMDKMHINDYLGFTIFYKPQDFTKEEFITFMLDQSQPIEGAVQYFIDLKKQYQLKVVALSNEARELNDYRIEKFKLNSLFDMFISSCYVGMRKPDPAMYRMACDVSQTLPEQALYVDDQLMYIEMARSLGIPSLHYQSLKQAKEYFDGLGLTLK
jgi:putative hydrolase of the HAD superfamily